MQYPAEEEVLTGFRARMLRAKVDAVGILDNRKRTFDAITPNQSVRSRHEIVNLPDVHGLRGRFSEIRHWLIVGCRKRRLLHNSA